MTKFEALVVRQKAHRSVLAAVVLFAVLSLYYTFLLWDMPYSSADVTDWALHTTEIPWKTFLTRLVHPRTEEWAVDGGRQFSKIRVTQAVLFKALHSVFGDNLDKPFVVCRILFAALLGLAVFVLLFWVTRSTTLSFLCPLFLLATPAYGMTFAEFREPEPLAQLFLVGFVILYFKILEDIGKNPQQYRLNRQFFLLVLALWFLGMLAIRTKEPEKIVVPAVTWSVLFFNPRFNIFKSFSVLKTNFRFWTLVYVTALLTLPLIWHKSYQCPIETSVNFLNPLRILCWNRFGWEAERAMSFFNLHRNFPSSLFGTLGILLSWCWLGGMIFLLLKGKKEKPAISYSVPFCAWLLSMLVLFAAGLGLWLPRLLVLPLLPFALLIFFTFHKMILSARKGTLILCGLAGLCTIQVGQNVRHTIYIRHEYAGKEWIAHHNSRVAVYEHMTGKKNPTALAMHRYFWQQFYQQDYLLMRKDLMWPGERNLDQTNPDYAQYKDILQKYGFFYFASFTRQPESEGVVFIKQLDCLNKSPCSWFMRKFTPGKVRPYYLYKVTALPN